MDLYTLTIVLVMTYILLALSMYAQYRLERTYEGPGWWAAGGASLGAGFMFQAVKGGAVPNAPAVLVSNMLILLGLGLIYVGILRYLGRREVVLPLVAGLVVALGLLGYFLVVVESLPTRRALASFFVIIISCMCARALRLYAVPTIRFSAKALSVLFLIMAGLFGVRAMLAIYCQIYPAPFVSSQAQILTMGVSLALSSLLTVGFIMMVNQRLSEESREAKERFELIFNTSPDGISITRLTDGQLVAVNPGFSELTGYSFEEVSGRSSLDVRLWKYPSERAAIVKTLLERGRCENAEAVFQGKHGEIIGMMSSRLFSLNGTQHILGVTRDITQRKRMEESLRESEARLNAIFSGANIGVSITDRSGKYVMHNRWWEEFLGYDSREICERTNLDITHPDDRNESREMFQRVIRGELDRYRLEKRFLRKDGTIVWGDLSVSPVRDERGQVVRMVGMVNDITERKLTEAALEETNRKLEALSTTDGLTGIANRRYFDEVLGREHARHVRSRGELSLIFLDVDHFKAYNDLRGHVQGDECLRQVGRVLMRCVARAADQVARYGGEEFACILPETGLEGALIIAERIREEIQALGIPHEASSVADVVTVSLGVLATRCRAGEKGPELIERADRLLYRAKAAGRNRIEAASDHGPVVAEDGSLNPGYAQLDWRETFSCGHPLLDAQHKALLRISNELLRTILNGDRQAELGRTISRLLGEARRHFQDEQMVLGEIAFPGLQQHSAEHARLLDRGMQLCRQCQTAELPAEEVFRFLAHDMVMVHMIGADRIYFPYVQASLQAAAS